MITILSTDKQTPDAWMWFILYLL